MPIEKGNQSPNWEGPYQVAKALHQEAYKFEDLNRIPISLIWNAENL